MPDETPDRALAAVGEHRSFSAAAKALHTVQSNVSTHVAGSNASSASPSIDRATNELTEEGRLVAERARRIDARVRRARLRRRAPPRRRVRARSASA